MVKQTNEGTTKEKTTIGGDQKLRQSIFKLVAKTICARQKRSSAMACLPGVKTFRQRDLTYNFWWAGALVQW